MSDLILPSAVVALAHKRLREAGSALRDKATAGRYDARIGGAAANLTDAVTFQDTDQRMLALIERARDMLAGADQAPMPASLRIGNGVGTYAMLGTTAFEWPSYAQYFTGDPVWMTGAMRRGSPDPNFSQVIVPSTEFALQVGQRGRQKTTDADERSNIDAFTGGMLAAVAN